MTAREYLIGPEFNLAKVQQKATTLAKRAQKKGLSGGYELTITERTERNPLNGQMELRRYLTIEGEPVKYDGWSFVAVVEYLGGQPVVTGSPWYEGGQVDRSALKPGYCDYCQTDRKRGKTIIVESDTGERKQVGTSCVKDFLGQEVNGAWYSDKDPFADLGSYGTGGTPMYQPIQFLTVAAQVIRQAGWTPSYKPGSTRSTVADLLWATGKIAKAVRDEFGYPTDEDAATAARALEFGRTMEGDSDYALNMRAVLAAEWVEPKRLGLIASAVAAMLKAEGELAAKAATPVVTEALYAEAGTKIALTDAVLTDVFGFDTQWGWTRVFVFVADGYRFKWMTSSDPNLTQGDTVDLKATVKGIDEYNGKVSTALLRVKAAVKQEAAA